MIKKLNQLINLLESIHEKEVDVDVSLDGELTIKITGTKINAVRIPEEDIHHGDVKLRTMEDEFDEFARSIAGRV